MEFFVFHDTWSFLSVLLQDTDRRRWSGPSGYRQATYTSVYKNSGHVKAFLALFCKK
ncbi:hypothetical protein SUBVAR_04763 [Subdoligranulum variabile DSM 15176]|uniref:Uncharacterized protein n=1 Tax=Subdoligranulum variabile DSM 15176 TaxID=411471 RepID=D1PK44_9FIRM|nr:hypothetical protein SUBVAR_04763 [Subdoligranulum variabile DSM 15176]